MVNHLFIELFSIGYSRVSHYKISVFIGTLDMGLVRSIRMSYFILTKLKKGKDKNITNNRINWYHVCILTCDACVRKTHQPPLFIFAKDDDPIFNNEDTIR